MRCASGTDCGRAGTVLVRWQTVLAHWVGLYMCSEHASWVLHLARQVGFQVSAQTISLDPQQMGLRVSRIETGRGLCDW